jgi:hypothetical protein
MAGMPQQNMQQQQYVQPNMQQPQGNYADVDMKTKKMAKTSLILGIISIVPGAFTAIIGVPVAIAGIVTGIMSKGKGNFGIILSIIGFILTIIVALLGAAAMVESGVFDGSW